MNRNMKKMSGTKPSTPPTPRTSAASNSECSMGMPDSSGAIRSDSRAKAQLTRPVGLTGPPIHGSHAHSSDNLNTQKKSAATTPTRMAGPITLPQTTLSMRSVRSMRDSVARDWHCRTAPAATP